MFGSQDIIRSIIADFNRYGSLTHRTKAECGVVIRAMDEILAFKHSSRVKVHITCK